MSRVRLSSPLVLASASPRRKELLANVGIDALVEPVDADESPLPGESPRDYVGRVARLKLGVFLSRTSRTEGFALAADTTVEIDGEILGKPETDAHAFEMLRRLAGRTHEVSTAVALGRIGEGLIGECLVTTRVRFRPCDDATLRRYVETGEGRDKAGSYAIQGYGSALAEAIEGSYTNVVGLPVAETVALLDDARALVSFP